MYTLFFLMCLAFLAALIVIPAVTAEFVPWWGTVLIILAELVIVRYTIFHVLGMMFAIFVSVGVRLGTMNMRKARLEVRGVTVVPKPDPSLVPKSNSGSADLDEDEAKALQSDAAGTRYVKVDCTITPAANSAGPIGSYMAGGFRLSSEGFSLPKFPPKEDPTRTGESFAAVVVKDGALTPVPLDGELAGSQQMELIFKCPPTLKGKVKLKYMLFDLGAINMPAS